MTSVPDDARKQTENKIWPVLFVGHGTPLNALRDNAFTAGWANLARTLGRPRAILAISAHWYTRGTMVTAMRYPPTLHDFGYQNMFHLSYPAPGSPELARRVADLLHPWPTVLDQDWGLDHGAWVVLRSMYPAADIPTVELSIDANCAPARHRGLGQLLRPLRNEGVLILASGNIVHNLELAIRQGEDRPYDWAKRYDAAVRDRLLDRDWDALVDYHTLAPHSALAVPTPEHYLPLLYALGAADPVEPIAFPIEGIDRGSMSMRAIVWGDVSDFIEPRIAPIAVTKSQP